ncbi:unnamed protein product, partial [Allacma fusca]
MTKERIIEVNHNREYYCCAFRSSCGGVGGRHPNYRQERRVLTRSGGQAGQRNGNRQNDCPESSPQAEKVKNQCSYQREQYFYSQQACCQPQCYQQSSGQEQCCPDSEYMGSQQCCPVCSCLQGYGQANCGQQQCGQQPVCYCYQSGGQAQLVSRQVYCCPGGSCCPPTCTV